MKSEIIKLVFFAGIATSLFAGCSTSGTADVEGEAFGVKAKVSLTAEPENKGMKKGEFTDGDDVTYELYDVDGDGNIDMAKKKGTNEWFKFTGIVLTPIDAGPVDVDIQSMSNESFGDGHGDTTNELVDAFVISNDASRRILRTVVYSINPNQPGPEAAYLDYLGDFSEAEATAQFGLNDIRDNSPNDPSIDIFPVDGSASVHLGNRFEVAFVFPTAVELPDLDKYDVGVSIRPIDIQPDGSFWSYGLAIEGPGTEVAHLAADLGFETMEYEFDGHQCSTVIRSDDSGAEFFVDGSLIDSFDFETD